MTECEKIAIFDIKENKIVYVNGVDPVNDGAEITNKLEFSILPYDFKQLLRVFDQDLYLIGREEMIELVNLIDREYQKVYNELKLLKGNAK